MSFFERVGRWALGNRAIILVVMGLLTCLALVQARLLRFDFQPSAMMQVSEEESAFADEVAARYAASSDDILLMVLHSDERDAVLTQYGLSLLHLVHELADQSGIAVEVQSLSNIPQIPDFIRKKSGDGASGGGLGAIGELFKKPADLLTAFSIPPPLIPSRPASLDDVARVKHRLATSALLPGTLVSADGSTAIVILKLHPRFSDLELLSPALETLEEVTAAALQNPDFAATLGSSPAFEVRYGGLPHIRVETVRNLKRDQIKFWPLVGGAFFLLMLVLFRNAWQALLPLVAVGLATFWIIGLLATTGQEVNIINNVTPTLILVVGICDGIHVVLRANRLSLTGLSPLQTAHATIAELGVPCFLTSLTSAIGFASLIVSHSAVLQSFGWLVGLGIMFAYVAVILMVPIAISLQKAPAVTPASPSPAPAPAPAQALNAWLERAMAFLTDHLLTRPKLALIATILLFILTLLIGSRVPIDAHAIEAFHEGHPIYETNRLIEEKLGGVLPLELELTIPTAAPDSKPFESGEILARVARFQAAIETLPGVISTMSVLNILAETQSAIDDARTDWRASPSTLAQHLPIVTLAQPSTLSQYLTPNHDRLRITARMSDAGIRQTLSTIDAIHTQSATLLNAPLDNSKTSIQNTTPPTAPLAPTPPIHVKETGTAYLTAIGLDLFVRDLFTSLATASITIFTIMIIAFRSWRVGLISLLPNLLPLTITLALMPTLGYQLNTSSVVIFTISIGLSVDNTIHFVARLRDVRASHATLNAAIHDAFTSSGRAIIASNILLIIGFSFLFWSDFEPTRRVATLTVVTIIASLITALLTLPPLLRLFYEPKLSQSNNS